MGFALPRRIPAHGTRLSWKFQARPCLHSVGSAARLLASGRDNGLPCLFQVCAGTLGGSGQELPNKQGGHCFKFVPEPVGHCFKFVPEPVAFGQDLLNKQGGHGFKFVPEPVAVPARTSLKSRQAAVSSLYQNPWRFFSRDLPNK